MKKSLKIAADCVVDPADDVRALKERLKLAEEAVFAAEKEKLFEPWRPFVGKYFKIAFVHKNKRCIRLEHMIKLQENTRGGTDGHRPMVYADFEIVLINEQTSFRAEREMRYWRETNESLPSHDFDFKRDRVEITKADFEAAKNLIKHHTDVLLDVVGKDDYQVRVCTYDDQVDKKDSTIPHVILPEWTRYEFRTSMFLLRDGLTYLITNESIHELEKIMDKSFMWHDYPEGSYQFQGSRETHYKMGGCKRDLINSIVQQARKQFAKYLKDGGTLSPS